MMQIMRISVSWTLLHWTGRILDKPLKGRISIFGNYWLLLRFNCWKKLLSEITIMLKCMFMYTIHIYTLKLVFLLGVTFTLLYYFTHVVLLLVMFMSGRTGLSFMGLNVMSVLFYNMGLCICVNIFASVCMYVNLANIL